MELEARKAILAALKANSTLNGANGVNGQWFKDVARGTPKYPYGLISLNVGSTNNLAAGVKGGDLRYVVKVVGKDNDQQSQQTLADQLAALIAGVLDEATLVADSPEFIWRCQQIGIVTFTEQDAQTQFYHAGGTYRVRMSS